MSKIGDTVLLTVCKYLFDVKNKDIKPSVEIIVVFFNVNSRQLFSH